MGYMQSDLVKQFQDVINVFNPCIDDYLYIMDTKNDYFFISSNAVARFNISENYFYHVLENLEKLVHPADYDLLKKDLELLLSGVKDFHNLQYRWLDCNREPVWINCRGKILCDEEGRPEYLIGCINEIGRKQKADNVSGLLGESSLQSELNQKIGATLNGFLLRLGIDNFKEINENRGMDYGDMILRRTAESIAAVICPTQMLYKVVADEFVVVDLDGGRVEDAIELYRRIQDKIDQFIEDNGYEVFYTFSAGILDFSAVEDHTYYKIMQYTEFSLNEAKNGGKNKYYVFDEKDYRAFQRKKALTHMMRQSVNHGFTGFDAYFQPIIDINENCLFSAETLLRYYTPETGWIAPFEFIPLLEESNLIIPVGRWVLEKAMEACSKIQKVIPHFRVSVNLSYVQVLKSNVLEEVLAGLDKYNLAPGSILIELTESGFLESNAYFMDFCNGLQEHGIPLVLDDFGTGYSNFHYLYNLNPSTIKIDRSFTLKALNNPYEYNLLQHMVDMTHGIDLKLCIEGIETKKELNKICEMKPDYIQGYYFGKPCPLEQFMEDFIIKK